MQAPLKNTFSSFFKKRFSTFRLGTSNCLDWRGLSVSGSLEHEKIGAPELSAVQICDEEGSEPIYKQLFYQVITKLHLRS